MVASDEPEPLRPVVRSGSHGRQGPDGAALYVAKVNGGGTRRLTRPLFEDADPDWQLPAPGD